jgi:hypothetical protein
MGILGGKKKDAKEAHKQPLLPRPLKEAISMAPHAPVPTVGRLAKVERVVVKELARYAALHAAIIEMRHEADSGGNLNMIEQRLEEILCNAKVVIK